MGGADIKTYCSLRNVLQADRSLGCLTGCLEVLDKGPWSCTPFTWYRSVGACHAFHLCVGSACDEDLAAPRRGM